MTKQEHLKQMKGQEGPTSVALILKRTGLESTSGCRWKKFPGANPPPTSTGLLAKVQMEAHIK